MLSLPKDTIFSLLKRMVFYRSFLLFLNMCKFKSKTENLGERMFSLCSFSSLCLWHCTTKKFSLTIPFLNVNKAIFCGFF